MMQFPPHIAQSKGSRHTHLIFDTAMSSVGERLCVDWRQLNYLVQMSGHEHVSDKRHAKLFTPWTPKDGAHGRRAEAFEYTSMVVFDLDKIDTCDIDEVVSWCGHYPALVHTSFSHGANGLGCFRIYIPLDATIRSDEYRAVHAALLMTLPELKERVDPSCADPSRCYFLPSCPKERHHLAKIRPSFGGPGVDIAALPLEIGKNAKQLSGPAIAPATSGPMVSTAILAPALQGSRNTSLCSLLGREFAKGFTPEGVRPRAMAFGHSCIPPMESSEIETTIQSMWRTHCSNHPAPVSTAPKELRLLTASDLLTLPQLQWRIKGLLPAKGLACIYGPSGSGKTFLSLDIACAISSGRPQWFGQNVKGAPVAYVALEGSAGLQQRLKAWEMHQQRSAPTDIRFVLGGFTLLEPHHAIELGREISQALGPGATVLVDTLNQSAPGSDENSSIDMGIVISNAKVLAAAIDGLVILVHHSGKDQSKGMRGHSSLHAALDAVIEVITNTNGRAWRITKAKDGELGAAHGFELVSYKVGQDTDGDEIRSCAVRASLASTTQRKPAAGKNQKTALQILSQLQTAYPNGIPVRDATNLVAAELDGPVGRRNSRAKEVIESLSETGHLLMDHGVVLIS